MRLYNKVLFLAILTIVFVSCDNSKEQAEENSLGAIPENNWIRIGPGGGGSTFIPTFSYSSTDKFMIRCDMTGAYLTNDGGNSFDQINYPNGSYSFAYDPLDSNTIYIGSVFLNKSSDGGKTWKRVCPFEDDIIKEVFVGDHANFNIILKKSSVFNITEDKGVNIFGESHVVENIRVDPCNNRQIYFSLRNYFFYTTDAGESWNRIKLKNNIDFIYTNTSSLSNEVYAFTDGNINIVDKTTWTATLLTYPTQMQPAFSFTGGTIRGDESTVFFCLHNDELLRVNGGVAPTTIWISRDLGKTWKESQDVVILNSINETPTYSKLVAAENDASNVYVVSSNYEEKKKDGTIAHWYGTLKSADAGKSWNWVWKGGGGSGQYTVKDGEDASNLKDAWVQKAFGGEYIRLIDVGVAPNNGDVAIVTDWYRSMKTMDGGLTWISIYSIEQSDGSYSSNGYDVTTTYGVHFDPFDKDHIVISYTDIGYHHSFNGGKSWVRSTDGIPASWHNTCYWVVFDPDIKDKIWSVWSGVHDFPRGKMTRNSKWKERGKGGVAVSTDGGRSWTPTVAGMGFDTPSASIVLDINSPVDSRILYVAAYGKGVYKSIDGGKTWELKNVGIRGSFAAFELTIQPDGTLFLITSAIPQHKNGQPGREVFMGAVYKSIDGADTWKKLNVGEKVGFPNGLTYDPDNPERLYLGSWADIYLSDLISGAVAKTTGGNELIELDGGIIMSEDGGETWTSIFDKNHYVYDVSVDPAHPGRLYCNTFDQGAYRSDDYGKTWNKLKGYDFHWGHRAIVDSNDPDKIYLTTFGSSVWHGRPVVENN